MCRVCVVGYKPTNPPQSWPHNHKTCTTQPPEKQQIYVETVVARVGLQGVAAIVWVKCGSLPHFAHNCHTPTTQCGGSVADPNQH